MSLTNLKIKNLKPSTKAYRVADSAGLCIEVTTAGNKLWRYRYRFNNKAQMFVIGAYPDVTLENARKARDIAKAQIALGKHPTREKKAAKLRQATEGQNTFKAVSLKWMEIKYSGLNAKYKERSLTRLEKYVFPIIGDLPITEIKIPDIARLLDQVSNRGTVETAKRVKQLTNQTFRWATQRGLCDFNPAADMRDLIKTAEIKHYPCIPVDELSQLLNAMENYDGNALVKYAMQFLALTWVRTGELIGARWEEINWDTQEWYIPKERMKMKRPHVVPLSKQAINILLELKTITGKYEFIFYSSRSKSKHMSNGAILMALNRMGYKNRHCGHGYRTLASTICNENGHMPDVIERQLAHEDADKIRSAYNRAEYMPQRKLMMQQYADLLDERLNGFLSTPFKVIEKRIAA